MTRRSHGGRRVVLVTTGGTIASRVDHQRQHVSVSDSGDALWQAVRAQRPDLAAPDLAVEVEVDQFCNIPSFNLDLGGAFRLARRVGDHLARPDVTGVAITHGTDTMEESAYLADLLLGSGKPAVFTGAQRHADEPDSDGPRNLADAVRLAGAAPPGLGAVVLFDQLFHAARDVTKTHTSHLDTFQSPGYGPLGAIDAGRILVHRAAPLHAPLRTERIEPAVDLIKLVIGADGHLVRAALAAGRKGLVLEAFGRGNASLEVLAAVRDAVAAGVPVVITSRCPQGRVAPVYGNGGGADLAAAGAIFAEDLSGVKARILLALLLGAGLSPPALAARFIEFADPGGGTVHQRGRES